MIIVPLIFAGVLMYPTWRTSSLEKEKSGLDSAGLVKWNQQNGEEYKRNKRQALKLGLDLQGGMYVTMEIDGVKLLEEAADATERSSEDFQNVLKATAKEIETSDEGVVDVFKRNFDKTIKPKGKSVINYYSIVDLKDATEEKIYDRLKRDVDEAIDQAMHVLHRRLDPTGTKELNIQKSGTRRLLMELPGEMDEKYIEELITTVARLEFKLLRGGNDILRAFHNIDQYLVRKNKGLTTTDTVVAPAVAKADSTKADTTKKDSTATATKGDSGKPKDPYAGLTDEQKGQKQREEYPFTTLFLTFPYQKGGNPGKDPYLLSDEVVQQFSNNPNVEFSFIIPSLENKNKIKEYLKDPAIARLLPNDLDVVLSAKAIRGTEKGNNPAFDMYIVKREPELTGDVITDAREDRNSGGPGYVVNMQMNDDGAEKWATITGANVNKRIAVVLDGEVYSAPVVKTRISGGGSVIEGMADVEEASLLRTVLKAGALKAPVKIIEKRVVGPSLGADSIRNGLYAAMIAFILVVLFMTVYYSGAGMVANIAMMINVLLNIAVLSAFGGTLSLPGIGGIILTIGLAVDANIIIFERVREELYKGRTMRAAIDEGFHHALPPILDSHVTTFISGAVLYFLGYGPIQGFATTLMIGIITTLFTGILVSRAVIDLIVSRSPNATLNFGQHKI